MLGCIILEPQLTMCNYSSIGILVAKTLSFIEQQSTQCGVIFYNACSVCSHMSYTCISVYRHISSPEFLELDVIALKGSEASHCKCSVLACEKVQIINNN